MEAQRQAALDAILDSAAPKKLIVAGPGTGKTHTFRAGLERAGGGVALTKRCRPNGVERALIAQR